MTDFITITIAAEISIDEVRDFLVENGSASVADANRFFAKIDVLENGCWRWNASHNRNKGGDYGRFYRDGKYWVTHRWIWEMLNGPVTDGLVLDHYRYPEEGCIGPRCCNPLHLRPVTPRENTLRGVGASAVNSRKSTCPAGHRYDKVSKRGFRICTRCERAYKQAWDAARLAAA
ncbi:HNH endonuclease signature motif containing protein [Sphaerisporangium rhizosphaerae]|uniref:HNH endonuclease signature motif containing protein n=1 Tax=Sphaerisporangium rhizosphaerae TaxID=2269375 RepID=A0ABW2NXL3_9ACTN